MDEDSPQDSEVFDINRIRELVELMKEHELSEVDLRHAPRRIRLRRGCAPPAMMAYPMPPGLPAVAATAPAASASSSGQPVAADEANVTYVRSPMVGTFYARPNPDAEAYVKVGSSVQPETIVCQIEAMKMFNEIPAGVVGRIVAVLVENEEPVDVNKPLFKIATG